MGRHSLPDDFATRPNGNSSRPRRRRTAVIATMLVLGVAAGTAFTAQGVLLSFSRSCEGSAVRLSLMTSPDRPIRACGRRQGAQGPGQVRRALPPCPGRRPQFVPGRRCALRRHPHPGPPDLAARLRSPAGSRRGTGEGIPITPGDSIASSPVTLAVTPSAAKALGRPKKEYSWAELMASTTKSDKVRLGVADPARSATGLLALTGIAASSDEQGGGATVGLCAGEVQRRRDPPTARTRTTAPSPAAP